MKTMMLMLGSALALAGCVDPELEDDVAADPTPRLSANGLLPSQLTSVSWNAAQLTQAQLDAWAATADGRAALRYVMLCALQAGISLEANYIDDDGNPATLPLFGSLGLGAYWTKRAMNEAEQKLVTACAASLTNEVGANITISQRGPVSALACTSSELANYRIQEGAFLGNMFGPEGILVCAGSGTTTQPGRTCASGAGCYTQLGSCSSFCTITANGNAVNCDVDGLTYPAPVTVYDSI